MGFQNLRSKLREREEDNARGERAGRVAKEKDISDYRKFKMGIRMGRWFEVAKIRRFRETK